MSDARGALGVIPGAIVTTSPLTVRVDGSTTAVPARRLSTYTPAVNDRVLIVPTSSELVVLARIV